MSTWPRAIASLGLVGLALVFANAWTWRPAPRPKDAPPTEFSAERARDHLEVIAQRPHAVGTPEHEAVRAYLVDRFRSLGLATEVEDTTAVRTRYQPARFARVRNILARRQGAAGGGKALALMAHYDSRSMTPGASDDGYGVAELLEIAHALQGAELARDVLFVITDGEELGLLGAAAFAREHPWASDIGALLNTEARGNAGPVLMFQTSDDNGALVRELAHATAHPPANSLSQAIYRRMPNDTDLSIFLPRTPALNFANLGGFERYHAPTDTVANADLGTLQQGGENLLAVTRALAQRSLPLPPEPNAVYFDVGRWFVRYAGAYETPLAVLSALLLLVFVLVATRRAGLRPRYVALAVLGHLLVVAAASVGAALLWAIASRMHADYGRMNAARPALKELYFAAFVALGVALALAAQARFRQRIQASELFAGAATVVASLALLLARAMPGAAFVFTWPVLAALPIAIALAASGRFERDDAAGVAAASAMSAVAIVILAPFIPQLDTAFGPAVAPVVAGLAANLVMLLAPAVRHILAPSRRLAPTVACVVAVSAFVLASFTAPFDRGYPRPDTVLYAVDGNTGRAFWLTPDPSSPPWAASTFAISTVRGDAPLPFPLHDVLAAPAPIRDEPERSPAITWVTATRVRVVPPEGAELLAVRIDHVAATRVDGERLPVDDEAASFRFYAPPAAGVEIELTRTPSAGPVTVRAASQRSGFPRGASPGTRSPESMPKPGMLPPWEGLLESDTTVVAVSSTR